MGLNLAGDAYFSTDRFLILVVPRAEISVFSHFEVGVASGFGDHGEFQIFSGWLLQSVIDLFGPGTNPTSSCR